MIVFEKDVQIIRLPTGERLDLPKLSALKTSAENEADLKAVTGGFASARGWTVDVHVEDAQSFALLIGRGTQLSGWWTLPRVG